MSSKTFVSNLALSHLGIGSEIQSFTSDSSKEAKACRQFFDIALDEMLRDFVWPFCTKVATLALVEENPTSEYRYAYSYPVDCLDIRKILSGIRNDTRQSRVHYRVVAGSSGNLIYTDAELAEIEYTSKVGQDPARWFPDFTMAFSYRLAAYIAPRVTAGDPFKVGQTTMQMFQLSIKKAAANARNEEQAEQQPDSEFINARN